jgi:hypothetical protein
VRLPPTRKLAFAQDFAALLAEHEAAECELSCEDIAVSGTVVPAEEIAAKASGGSRNTFSSEEVGEEVGAVIGSEERKPSADSSERKSIEDGENTTNGTKSKSVWRAEDCDIGSTQIEAEKSPTLDAATLRKVAYRGRADLVACALHEAVLDMLSGIGEHTAADVTKEKTRHGACGRDATSHGLRLVPTRLAVPLKGFSPLPGFAPPLQRVDGDPIAVFSEIKTTVSTSTPPTTIVPQWKIYDQGIARPFEAVASGHGSAGGGGLGGSAAGASNGDVTDGSCRFVYRALASNSWMERGTRQSPQKRRRPPAGDITASRASRIAERSKPEDAEEKDNGGQGGTVGDAIGAKNEEVENVGDVDLGVLFELRTIPLLGGTTLGVYFGPIQNVEELKKQGRSLCLLIQQN